VKLIIVSGLSGAGKSIVLHTLEDLDYYCIDNLPVGMLRAFAEQFGGSGAQPVEKAAVGIDARNQPHDLQHFPQIVEQIEDSGLDCEIFFIHAGDETLLQRFSETRRRHPLTRDGITLAEAIELERRLLAPIAERADMQLDTSRTNVHQLRDLVRERVERRSPRELSLLFQSFGYKHGLPGDADFVFDLRCLPNPHWEAELRPLTGMDERVGAYLAGDARVARMIGQITQFLEDWIPRFEAENRSYLTVALGCTGGQHRSVYVAERLAAHFRGKRAHVTTRHRELT